MWKFSARVFETPATNNAKRNLLVFGLAGSGKSAFINSCLTLLASVSNTPKTIAVAGGDDVRVTTELKSWRLADVDIKQFSEYRMWDTWGIESGTGPQRQNLYANQQFEEIIAGQKASGWTLAQAERDNYREFENYRPGQVNPELQQLCVVFFLPAANIDIVDDPMTNKLKEFVVKATKRGVPSVVVLSKMDLVVPDFANGIVTPAVKTYVDNAAKTFSLPSFRVLPLVSYHSQSNRTFAIDKVIATALLTILQVTDDQHKAKIDKTTMDLLNS